MDQKPHRQESELRKADFSIPCHCLIGLADHVFGMPTEEQNRLIKELENFSHLNQNEREQNG